MMKLLGVLVIVGLVVATVIVARSRSSYVALDPGYMAPRGGTVVSAK